MTEGPIHSAGTDARAPPVVRVSTGNAELDAQVAAFWAKAAARAGGITGTGNPWHPDGQAAGRMADRSPSRGSIHHLAAPLHCIIGSSQAASWSGIG
jgi:hypothetical protein